MTRTVKCSTSGARAADYEVVFDGKRAIEVWAVYRRGFDPGRCRRLTWSEAKHGSRMSVTAACAVRSARRMDPMAAAAQDALEELRVATVAYKDAIEAFVADASGVFANAESGIGFFTGKEEADETYERARSAVEAFERRHAADEEEVVPGGK